MAAMLASLVKRRWSKDAAGGMKGLGLNPFARIVHGIPWTGKAEGGTERLPLPEND
jgi:hypothetical protein